MNILISFWYSLCNGKLLATDIEKLFILEDVKIGPRRPVKDARIKSALAAILCLAVVGGLSVLPAQDAMAAETVCSRGDILLCEDWQWSADPAYVGTTSDWKNNGWILGDSLTNYVDNNVYCNDIGNNSSCALQLAIQPGENGTQYPNHPFATQTGRVYARFYLKYSKGFVFYPVAGDSGQKVAYLRPSNTRWRTQLAMAGWDAGWDSVDFSTTGCSRENLDRTYGQIQLDNFVHDLLDTQMYTKYQYACTAIISPDPRPLVKINSGQWYSVEFMVKANSGRGVKDGELGLWVNGRQIISRQNVDIGANGTDFINDFWITSYYGGGCCHKLTTPQYIWYDNIVVSSNYIGPMGSSAQIQPPTNLTVR